MVGMALTLGMVTADSADPRPLAQWWAERFGGEIVSDHDGWFVVVKIPKVMLGFQKVEDPTPGKNRLHLDLHVDTDLDQAIREFLDAGATLVGDRGDESFRWITLADPQGNQFCVAGGE